MCRFKSGVILKNRVVLAPEGRESHSDLLESLNIDDNTINAKFVRVELIPPNGNISSDIKNWDYNLDQDYLPEWYKIDPKRYEDEFRNSVKDYVEKRAVRICNLLWTTAVKGNCTYYFLYGTLFDSRFGKNNNFAESDIITKLREHKLAEDLRKEFGDRLIPITTDLTSLDGLKDYGKVTGDVLSIPTIGTLMEFGEDIPPIGKSYWTPTPNQTPSRGMASCVRCVDSGGGVGYSDCDWREWGVRPFFILQS